MSKSNRFQADDMRGVFRLLLDCQDLRHDPVTCQRHMINGLCRLIGARQGTAVRFNNFLPGQVIGLPSYIEGGWPDPKTTALWNQWGRRGKFIEDPMIELALHRPGQIVSAVRSELITDRCWKKTSFYQECLRPARIKDVAVAFFRMEEPGQTFAVALHRQQGDKLFRSRQRKILTLFIEEYHRLYRDGKVQYLNTDEDPALSRRQQQLLVRLLTGQAPKSIAYELGLSVHTIRTYVRDLYRRLGVSGRAELMAKYQTNRGVGQD